MVVAGIPDSFSELCLQLSSSGLATLVLAILKLALCMRRLPPKARAVLSVRGVKNRFHLVQSSSTLEIRILCSLDGKSVTVATDII